MSRSGKIAVEGFEGLHKVVENMGYQHSRGVYAKAVLIDGQERIAIAHSRSGPWRINQPLILLDRAPTTEFYTVEERDEIRKNMREANAQMRKTAEARGWTINPRVAALKASRAS